MSDAPTYDSPDSASTTVAQVERAALCDLFDRLGPNAPTLSGDWDTHHLVAHLKVREGTPLGVVKMLRPKVADEEVENLVASSDYASLVNEIRQGPPRLSAFGVSPVDRQANALEYFIHHEDVRRAASGWTTRRLPGWAEDQLWHRIKVFARVMMRKCPLGVVLERSDNGETSTAVKKGDPVVVKGLPSEIALFVYGRSDVAQVELSGSDTAVARLRRMDFGL